MRHLPFLLAGLFVITLFGLVAAPGAQARTMAATAAHARPALRTPAPVAAPGGEGITLVKTVGDDSGTCEPTDQLTVTLPATVTYCYRVTNNTSLTLTHHNLIDSHVGNIVTDFNFVLAPGGSLSINTLVQITQTTVSTAEWIALIPAAYNITTGICTDPNISGTGQALNLSDDGAVGVVMPYHFQLFDRVSNHLSVSNNGVALLGTLSGNASVVNVSLPTAAIPYGFAPFWDDMDSDTGNVYAGVFTYTTAAGAGPAGDVLNPPDLRPLDNQPQGALAYYVVRWHNRPHYFFTGAATFSVGMALPGQGLDGYIFMCYLDIFFGNASYNYGASATIGLNGGPGAAVQYSHNTAHPELHGSNGLGFLPTSNPVFYLASDTTTVTALYGVRLPLVTK